MTDQQNREANTPDQAAPDGMMSATFETDEVSATRGREQGLGVGARELNAQRDPGVEVTADQNEAEIDEADEDQDDVAELDGNLAVQGEEDEAEEAGSGV